MAKLKEKINQISDFASRPMFSFYAISLYAVLGFGWWIYYNISASNKHFQNSIGILEKTFEENNLKAEDVLGSTGYNMALAERENSNLIVLGVGLLFILILIWGAYKIHAGIKKELDLHRQQRNFLLSITHELKSPIAGIKLSLETLYTRKLDFDQQRRLLQNSLKDTERLKSLVDNILMAAKIENQSIIFTRFDVSLSKIVEESARNIQDKFGRQRAFNIAIEPGIFVEGDSGALTSIIINLVENAIKYSPLNSTIYVELIADKNTCKLIVKDEGIGIEEAEKEKIFTKFYRVGNEDTRKAKGTGLGLFIVKQLVDFHEGTIRIEDNVPNGSIFTVEVPRIIPRKQLNSLEEKKIA
ncbi:MAG: HAMP domain-containing sensor histidine kinase [Chitinophagales bacterium]